MADRTVSERLQPSLLDRLTDDQPQSLNESRAQRVIDIARLREIIQRDLSYLLNTDNLGSALDHEVYPNVARSTLNYGIAPSAGEHSTTMQVKAMRKSIAEAIEAFEPRIIRGTTLVQLREETADNGMTVFFDIRSDMWAQPMPLELYLRSRVDMSTGQVEMDRGG